MRWVGVHLGALSLEAFAATLPATEAGRDVVLLDGAVVSNANAAAQARGVRLGMKRATALALAPDLLVGKACARRNREALAAVAQALLAFTPMVTPEPWADLAATGPPPLVDALPHTVLADVSSTLAYWGGRGRPAAEQLAQLLQRLQQALAPLQHTVQVASAPTALGAALLARQAPPVSPASLAHGTPLPASHAGSLAGLARALDASPVWLLGPGREHWEALQGMGLRTLSDLRGLPRSGLARRFGAPLLDELDRAYGDRPDPRHPVRVPERFLGRLELFHRADTMADVLPGAHVLLARLVAWLQARQVRARRLVLEMHHEPSRRLTADGQVPEASTPLDIALAEPAADAVHLQGLLAERLARLPLPAPTLELSLHCHDVVQRPPPNGELFASAASQREGLARLVERLQARLGADGVRQPMALDEHRPERATGWQAAGHVMVGGAAAAQRLPPAASRRPVWLVEPPQALHDGAHGPQWHGEPLQLVSGPERLETGWWDNGFVERDYFIAQARDGMLLWIYRLRRPEVEEHAHMPAGWFLQGRFG